VIGRTLGGRYEVLSFLSEGGMAQVYRGRRVEDGSPVAIKILRDQYAHNAEFIARFEREAQAVSQLSHPHMVKVFDHGDDGDVHFIVMEFIAGEDLKTLLRRTGSLPESRARDIGGQVCDVLEYAHGQGIVHRDIKPQNILLTLDGQVKVTDFGIARALSAATITETGTVLGSVQYISPEQARGGGVSRSADLYSLGVVLYEAVTGHLPFDGDAPITIALKHIHEPPPRPQRDGAHVSRAMEGIILKALAKSPRDRYRSAREMREDLLGDSELWRETPGDVESTTVVPRLISAEGARSRGRSAVPRMLGPFLGAASALLVIFVGIAIGWQALNDYLNVPEVTVPNFVGRSLVEAQGLARQNHLSVQVVQQSHSQTIAAGFVMGQEPSAGDTVKINRVIALTSSLGAEMVAVPDVYRHSMEEARFILEQSRLVVGEVREAYDQTVPSGFILAQDPAPGASVARGTAVNLTVSKGQQTLVLPNLVGQSLDETRQMLEPLGVTLREVTQVARSDVPPGQVVSMMPPAGTQIHHGDAVTVTIAMRGGGSGTPPPQPIVTATPTQTSPGNVERRQARIHLVVPEGPPRQTVKILVIDQQGVHVAYEGFLNPGENLDRDVSGVGYTIVQVYLNSRLIQEIRP
jgi:eukaryotic-like serine/threonine-protein kinase